MDSLNREFQRTLLKKCFDWYPLGLSKDQYQEISGHFFPPQGETCDELVAECFQEMLREPERKNLYYLAGHGLIEFLNTDSYEILAKGVDATDPEIRITARGIDLLLDDGGLSAILNTVTVKFDVDNVRKLVEAGLLKADVPEEKKSALKEALRKAPGTVVQKITDKLLEKAVNDPMALVRTLGEVLDKAI